MVIGKPAPFVSAFVDAVAAAIRTPQPHHAMSVTQRTWLAFCITAVLVTNSICWARFARASLDAIVQSYTDAGWLESGGWLISPEPPWADPGELLPRR